jgi:hypothetical protein
MTSAAFGYQSQGVTFFQCAALVGIAMFVAWQVSRPGESWWSAPIVRVFAVFAAVAYLFMTWAAATG